MLFRSRLVSFALALSIAVITTAFLSLEQSATPIVLFIAFAISFSSSFLLFYFTLEFLVLSEVNEAYAVLEKLKKKEFKVAKKRLIPTLSPIKKLNYEIYSYASKKQKEIDHLKKLAIYRREFLADVSHELKTPIFAAQGFLHTLIDGAIDDESVRYKFLHKAAKSLDGLQKLVEDLFSLSKMEAGIITMNLDHFNIYERSQEVIDQLEEQARHKKIKLDIKAAINTDLWVKADPQRIQQVMMNLVENAVKYSQAKGQVLISFEELEKEILIRVEDKGPGIPPEHLDRIFERFYRVEKSRAKSKGGSGLGLAIVKHILEAHDSKIQVSSKVNQGTSFSFKLKKVSPDLLTSEDRAKVKIPLYPRLQDDENSLISLN